jgi:hypothetical protein
MYAIVNIYALTKEPPTNNTARGEKASLRGWEDILKLECGMRQEGERWTLLKLLDIQSPVRTSRLPTSSPADPSENRSELHQLAHPSLHHNAGQIFPESFFLCTRRLQGLIFHERRRYTHTHNFGLHRKVFVLTRCVRPFWPHGVLERCFGRCGHGHVNRFIVLFQARVGCFIRKAV